ncbi:Hemerythrin HHE cation binding domain-containing protein [Enhydrobacter aerosaccus]|uniref:Hemerythrin HHE cation binding domain-containing protein n=1 Tax=Enhydrobacter aerosaccus TaxID=225324 RepID=A0A1T4T1A4_9HYPH|nr:hemerythrin domain-containing protein [Enhydrobacter aerosaccus]SKA34177.1 Hemerythrin HHE cation binding domain-containing protein [Enhydrobacter aerosaccus]
MARSTKQGQGNKKQQSGSGVSQATDNAGAVMSGSASNSAIETLKQDHRRVEGLFQQFEQSDDDHQKEELVRRICSELIVHTRLEEEIFYPACRDADVEDDIMDEAQVEHDGAKVLINDLLDSDSDMPFWEAKVSVLKEMIKHHVSEEEKPDGVMAQAEENDIDDAGLVERLRRRKQELQERGIGQRPARPVAIHLEAQEGPQGRMGRRGMGERSERGRYMGEDEGRYGGGRGRYEESGRGHGGWYGDSQAHAEAARERWGEGRRGSRYEDEYEDRSSGRGRYGEDYDERRGHGGWYGDPRGHSQASQRGWEERRGSRDDDDRYARSRRDEDDDDRDHGGWFGDSRGHSEASRRGWQHRR